MNSQLILPLLTQLLALRNPSEKLDLHSIGNEWGAILAQDDCNFLQNGYAKRYSKYEYGEGSPLYIDLNQGYNSGYSQEFANCPIQTLNEDDKSSQAYLDGVIKGKALAAQDCENLSQPKYANYHDDIQGPNYNAGVKAGYEEIISKCSQKSKDKDKDKDKDNKIDDILAASPEGATQGKHYGELDCDNTLYKNYTIWGTSKLKRGKSQDVKNYNAAFKAAYQYELDNCGRVDTKADAYQEGYQKGKYLGQQDCKSLSKGYSLKGYQSKLQPELSRYAINGNAGLKAGYENAFACS